MFIIVSGVLVMFSLPLPMMPQWIESLGKGSISIAMLSVSHP
jgi:hypothetical protein